MPDFNIKALVSGALEKITGTIVGDKTGLDVNVIGSGSGDGALATATKQDTIIENQTSGDQKTQIVDSDGDPIEPVDSVGITPPSNIVPIDLAATAADTEYALASIATPGQCAYVMAKSGNTGLVYVGAASEPLIELAFSDFIPIPIDDLSKLKYKADNAGEGLQGFYLR